jgi:Na+-transporting NADH:ubiquinone oxidoreductase subunit A
MGEHNIRKGLNLPIVGAPEQRIDTAAPATKVALIAHDYIGMKPTMRVEEGEEVKRGQILFEDKKIPGVMFTAPGAGRVIAIRRGDKRAFQSLVIELNERERAGRPGDEDYQIFQNYTGNDVAGLSRDQIKALLVESGQWTALRARPFGRVAQPLDTPHSIFVAAMDTNPHAPSADALLAGNEQPFEKGLQALVKLTDGPVFLCKAAGSAITAGPNSGVTIEEFSGPHPAGTPGLHIHLLDPVSRAKKVWYLGLQDVIAIGRLLQTGRLDVTRVVALAGPVVKRPRLLRTRLGASLDELVAGELAEGENRVISGSVLSGRTAMGAIHGYLGRYAQQVSALKEGREREFLGWLAPGLNLFSATRAFLSTLIPTKKFAFSTSLHGSPRAMVPIGVYERVMPMDIPATFLLRSIVVGDAERAEQLGVLELEEEDIALCTFVSPSKYDYGVYLRDMLTTIEREG